MRGGRGGPKAVVSVVFPMRVEVLALETEIPHTEDIFGFKVGQIFVAEKKHNFRASYYCYLESDPSQKGTIPIRYVKSIESEVTPIAPQVLQVPEIKPSISSPHAPSSIATKSDLVSEPSEEEDAPPPAPTPILAQPAKPVPQMVQVAVPQATLVTAPQVIPNTERVAQVVHAPILNNQPVVNTNDVQHVEETPIEEPKKDSAFYQKQMDELIVRMQANGMAFAQGQKTMEKMLADSQLMTAEMNALTQDLIRTKTEEAEENSRRMQAASRDQMRAQQERNDAIQEKQRIADAQREKERRAAMEAKWEKEREEKRVKEEAEKKIRLEKEAAEAEKIRREREDHLEAFRAQREKEAEQREKERAEGHAEYKRIEEETARKRAEIEAVQKAEEDRVKQLREKVGKAATCPHTPFEKYCLKQAFCCQKFFHCINCHGDLPHSMNPIYERRWTDQMKCLFCEQIGPLGETCTRCNEEVAHFFCKECKILNAGRSSVRHCKECDTCVYEGFLCDHWELAKYGQSGFWRKEGGGGGGSGGGDDSGFSGGYSSSSSSSQPKTCRKCKGSKRIKCTSCKGKGVWYKGTKGEKTCPTCKGSLQEKCNSC